MGEKMAGKDSSRGQPGAQALGLRALELTFPPFGDHSFLEIRHMSGSGFGDAVTHRSHELRRPRESMGHPVRDRVRLVRRGWLPDPAP